MTTTGGERRQAILFTAGIGLAFIAFRYRHKFLEPLIKFKTQKSESIFSRRTIHIIENTDECQNVVGLLKRHIKQFNVLGFDLEWVTVSGKRHPIALLQLSSHTGLCALFRLCKLRHIPKSLREILEDDNVIKVGIGTFDDAQKLAQDYGVGVASTLDLRFIAAMTGHKAEGLAKLTKSLLGEELDKSWQLACSNWEAKELSQRQRNYAANDVFAAMEIFKRFIKELEPRRWTLWTYGLSRAHIERMEPFFDIRFKHQYLNNITSARSEKVYAINKNLKAKSSTTTTLNGKVKVRGMCTRTKAMYDNCFLQAPDGEVLCSIDRHKAQWYVDRNLGSVLPNTQTYTVRLNFEPAGRAVGEDGRYYQIPKENQCVVCGRRDCYIRKSVVPREYRRHFPVVMKSHTSHDVLLLCPNCHQLSNISDWKIRRHLATMCNAPLTNDDAAVKLIENPDRKRVRSAARALKQEKNKLPKERQEELAEVVLKHFNNGEELTDEMLEEAANINTMDANSEYRDHGETVVKCFQSKLGGLIELEKIWREHFLKTMQPQHMPPFWSINHNVNRLEILAQEGRVDKQDLIYAGLELQDGHNNPPIESEA